MDRRGSRRPDARRSAPRHDRRRNHRRRRIGHRLPPQHHDPLPIHRLHGGFRVPRARRLHHGPRHAPNRRTRQVVHPPCHGIRVQRPRHHGLPHHRKQKQPPDYHTYYAVHVMQRPNSDLYPADCHLLPGERRRRDARTLPAGHRARRRNGPPHAAVPLPRGRDAVRHGAPALPPPDLENHALPHVGQVCAVSQKDGRHDPRRVGHRLGVELLPPHGQDRRNRGPLRKLLPRKDRKGLRTGFPTARVQLEGRRRPPVGVAGQRDRRLDARRALRRRSGGPRCGRTDGCP